MVDRTELLWDLRVEVAGILGWTELAEYARRGLVGIPPLHWDHDGSGRINVPHYSVDPRAAEAALADTQAECDVAVRLERGAASARWLCYLGDGVGEGVEVAEAICSAILNMPEHAGKPRPAVARPTPPPRVPARRRATARATQPDLIGEACP